MIKQQVFTEFTKITPGFNQAPLLTVVYSADYTPSLHVAGAVLPISTANEHVISTGYGTTTILMPYLKSGQLVIDATTRLSIHGFTRLLEDSKIIGYVRSKLCHVTFNSTSTTTDGSYLNMGPADAVRSLNLVEPLLSALIQIPEAGPSTPSMDMPSIRIRTDPYDYLSLQFLHASESPDDVDQTDAASFLYNYM